MKKTKKVRSPKTQSISRDSREKINAARTARKRRQQLVRLEKAYAVHMTNPLTDKSVEFLEQPPAAKPHIIKWAKHRDALQTAIASWKN